MRCPSCGCEAEPNLVGRCGVCNEQLRDPEDIVVEHGPPRRLPRLATEPVERRTKVTWCVGGKEVLTDLGDGTYEIVRWPHASIEDLERLYYVIAELLTINQTKTQS